MMKFRFLAAALFILPTASANAFATNYNWTGFYAGVIAGYSFGDLSTSVVGGTGAPTITNLSGALAGVAAGANFQTDQFVFGVEGDFAKSGITGDNSCSPTQTCTNDLNWISTLRARAGFAIDDVLLFTTAGIAIGSGTSITSPATPGSTGTDTQTFVGWTAGLGGEYALNRNIRLKAEYSYTDLGTRTSPVGTISLSNALIGRPTFHTIKVGVNFAFDTD